ncbi:MAG: hypothetical protein ACKVT2_19705 [Saprospiraceae bacterium]
MNVYLSSYQVFLDHSFQLDTWVLTEVALGQKTYGMHTKMVDNQFIATVSCC